MLKDNFKLNVENALGNLRISNKEDDMNSEILTQDELKVFNEDIVKKNTLNLESE